MGIPSDNFRLATVRVGNVFHVNLKLPLCGGKGGFGSLLRGGQPGVKSKATTNYDACRDLNGRRLRHMNNQRKLQEWEEGKDERERLEREREAEEEKTFEEIEVPRPDIEVLVRFQKDCAQAVNAIHDTVSSMATNGKTEEEEGEELDLDLSLYGLEEIEYDVAEAEMRPSQKRRRRSEAKEVNGEAKKRKTEPKSPGNDSMEKTSTQQVPVEKPMGKSGNKDQQTNNSKAKSGFSKDLSLETLESLGRDALKRELQDLGLKFGGTTSELAKRLHFHYHPEAEKVEKVTRKRESRVRGKKSALPPPLFVSS